MPPTSNLQRVAAAARRGRLGSVLVLLALAVVAGVLLGRQSVPSTGPALRQAVEQRVLPLALDADGIWTSSLGGRPSVSEALVTLTRDDDPEPVLASLEAWLEAYDRVLAQIAEAELPAPARAVQRQYLNGVTLSRDAVEVLGIAARLEDRERRTSVLTEVSRLRLRSEQFVQSARVSTADLGGGDGPVVPPGELPGLPDPSAGASR